MSWDQIVWVPQAGGGWVLWATMDYASWSDGDTWSCFRCDLAE